MLQRAHSAGQTPTSVPPIVNEVLRSPGHPLDKATRNFMEPRFGTDFGHVRVHADGHAARSARAVSALAYTVGPHLVFGEGQYKPQAADGRRLLAHELSHVLQQRGSAQPAPQARRVAASGTELELEADRTAQDALSNRAIVAPSTAETAVQRTDGPSDGGKDSSKDSNNKDDKEKPPEKPSCGPVELYTHLDLPWPIPDAYFRGSTQIKEDQWKKEMEAAGQGKCTAKGSFEGVKISWDLGNPNLGTVFTKNLNKNDLTFDINTFAIYDGKPCCTCFTGNASWSLDVQITKGKETGKTKSPITGSKAGNSCKGQQCCTISETLNVSTSSGYSDMVATVAGSVQLDGSTYGEVEKEKKSEAGPGTKKQGGLSTAAKVLIGIGAAVGAAGLAVGGYFLGKALSK